MERKRHRTAEEAYFDDSDEETNHALSQGRAVVPTVPDEVEAVSAMADEEELDPLDAFMADINCKLEETKPAEVPSAASTGFWAGNETCDSEDITAEYLEVAAVKAATQELEPSDESEDEGPRRSQQVLPLVDHSSVTYREFKKNIYKEPADITSMSVEEKAAFRAEKSICVLGFQVAQALSSFKQLEGVVERGLLQNVCTQGWNSPTPIQSQSIPVALEGRDLVAVASTGSGKTGAYLVPLVQRVCKTLDEWRITSMASERGPLALVICPTRELAFQIYETAKSLSSNLKLRVSCFVGGYDKTQQFQEINRGIEILIGNPGRLIDLACMKGGLQMIDVVCVVLDEADKMLDLGFLPEVISITKSIRPDKQVLMFSATMAPDVEKLGKQITNNRAVNVVIGKEGQASSLIEQRPVVFVNESKKANWLVQNIPKLVTWNRQVLIFCNSHGRVLDLTAVVNDVLSAAPPAENGTDPIDDDTTDDTPSAATLAPAFARLSRHLSDKEAVRTPGQIVAEAELLNKEPKAFAKSLFGDMNQGERASVLSSFKKRRFPVLIATDVASRGLDIAEISTVMSYDAPTMGDTHVHRIGRTGRAGVKGVAYTLLTRSDQRGAGFVAESMEIVGQTVPKHVMQLAMSYEPFKSAKLRGVSFIAQTKPSKSNTTGPAMSSVGLGFGTVEQAGAKNRWNAASFVRSTEASAGPVDDVPKPSRRWDSAPQSSQTSEAPQKKQMKPKSKPEDSGMNTLHVEMSGASCPKVFNPDDDISSDSDSGKFKSSTPAPQPSLLNLQKRKIKSTQNQLVLAQQRALQAAIAANIKPASQWTPASQEGGSSLWGETDGVNPKRKSRWGP